MADPFLIEQEARPSPLPPSYLYWQRYDLSEQRRHSPRSDPEDISQNLFSGCHDGKCVPGHNSHDASIHIQLDPVRGPLHD
jgi:hypothetical protein